MGIAAEGIFVDKIKKVGDVMYDAALYFAKSAEKKSNILNKLDLKPKEYILATVHRQENTDDPKKLESIITALAKAPLSVVFPLHPRTKKKLVEFNLSLKGKIKAIDPVGYLDMIVLEKNSLKIATDSGGVQKEAYFYNVPCITLREETEWMELVEAGVNKLSGSDQNKISELLVDFQKSTCNNFLYGKGDASRQIVKTLLK